MGKLFATVVRRPSAGLRSALLNSAAPTPSTSTSTSTSTSPSTSPSTGAATQNFSVTQARHATYVLRPRRAYKFTQLVQLSDGSSFTVRTTSPQPLYRSAKDSRNHLVWQPSEKSLRNVEVDEAGKLAAFRERFGRAWDVDASPAAEPAEEGKAAATTAGGEPGARPAKTSETQQRQPKEQASSSAEDATDVLSDLLSGYAAKEPQWRIGGLSSKGMGKETKKKKK